MTRAVGADASHYQDPMDMRWNDWGLSFGWGRGSIGTFIDEVGLDHADLMVRAGYVTGVYHALHEDYPIRDQAQRFFVVQSDRYKLPPALDVERVDLNEGHVLTFLDEWARLGGKELIIYTSANSWHQIVGRGMRTWAKRLKLWCAAYPYDNGTDQALKNTAPENEDLTFVPDPWINKYSDRPQWDFFQHTGEGRLPGYNRNLDLNVYWDNTPALYEEFGTTQLTAFTKLGPHHLLGGRDTIPWMQANPSVVKAVGDLGVLQFAPEGTLRLGRMADDGQLDGGGFDANRFATQISPMEMAQKYMTWLEPYINLNPWVDIWEGPNEQVIENPSIMAWYGAFLHEFARLMKFKGKRAGLGGWAVGNPKRELNLWPHYTRALQAVLDYNAVLTRHEYGPLDGFNSLRYRYDNAQFSMLGYGNLPVIISECGADDAGGMTRWKTYYNGNINRYWSELLQPYSLAMEQDSYCLGGTVFTVGGGANWSGFDVDRTGLVDLVINFAENHVPPTENDMEAEERRKQTLIHAQAIVDLNADPLPEKHTLTHLTNQQVINLFYSIFGTLSKLESVLTAEQRTRLYAFRTLLYNGPAVEDMSLTAEDKARVIAKL